MFDRQIVDLFLDKVPGLKTPLNILLTVFYLLALALLCGIFFLYTSRLGWYGSVLSQLVMALVVVVIGYIHIRTAAAYREKYTAMAYQHHFYHLMIPYLVTWYACFFHPVFVSGPLLFPWWLAIGIAVLLFALFLLSNLQIERAGFHMVTHGMNVFTIFPEEATVVYGEIYEFIRHPLYFSLTCGCFALALVRNNAAALVVAFLQLIPAYAIGYLEDRELVAREGDRHREYIAKTGAIFPRRNVTGFLKLLFKFGKKP